MHVFDVLTLFPDFFESPLKVSILNRAIDRKIIEVNIANIRDFSTNKQCKVDDKPYGGGAGMVMGPQPLYDSIHHFKKKHRSAKVIIFSAKGRKMDQALLRELVKHKKFILVAGHYEGIDERVIDHCCDYELCIGDYVLTGGEYGCLLFIDGLTRLIEGTLLNSESHQDESFEDGLLEYDQYTRPEKFRKWEVPEVLLSGDHAKIREWRAKCKIKNTEANRPDLLRR